MSETARVQRPDWNAVGAAWPLFALLLLSSDPMSVDGWRSVFDGQGLTDRDAAIALAVTVRRARRWRKRLERAGAALFAPAGRGFTILIRDHEPMRYLLIQTTQMGREAESIRRSRAEAHTVARAEQMLRFYPVRAQVN